MLGCAKVLRNKIAYFWFESTEANGCTKEFKIKTSNIFTYPSEKKNADPRARILCRLRTILSKQPTEKSCERVVVFFFQWDM